MRTWQKEALVVGLVLVAVVVATGARPIEWLGSAAVFFMFMHAQVSFRLAEAEDARRDAAAIARTFDPHSVECHRFLVVYHYAKEACWCAYFVLLGAWSALVGVAIFLLYPAWRRYHLRRRSSA